MGKRERDKGMAAEREVRDLINALSSFHVFKAPHSGALEWMKGDLVGFPKMHLEVKRQERVSIDKWCEQAEGQAEEGQVPAVVWRRSREPWRIAMPLDHFIVLMDLLINGLGDE